MRKKDNEKKIYNNQKYFAKTLKILRFFRFPQEKLQKFDKITSISYHFPKISYQITFIVCYERTIFFYFKFSYRGLV